MIGGVRVELLDVKSLLEKAVKSADSIIVTANRQRNGEIKAVECNALTNAYRSAGTLYLATAQAIEGSKYIIKSGGDPTELTPEDRDRLDQIAKLLEKPSKRKGKK